MIRLLRTSCVLLCLLLGGRSAADAEDYVFVFSAGTSAEIYNAASLQLVGAPTIASGGLQAIGVPDPNNPVELLKIFVISRDAVTVLAPNPPFAVLDTIALSATGSVGERSARLSPNGRWLLVAAGDVMDVFDADAEGSPPPVRIEMGSRIKDFGILPDSSKAYVIREGSLFLDEISLRTNPPQRLAGPVELPVIPNAMGVAPNAAAIYTAQAGGVSVVDPFRNEVTTEIELGAGVPRMVGFPDDAPLAEMFIAGGTTVSVYNIEVDRLDSVISPPIAIDKVVSPRRDLFYLFTRQSGQVFRTPASGLGLGVLRNPATNTQFGQTAVDIELDPFGRFLFIGFASGAPLVVLDSDANELLGEVTPGIAPAGIDVVSTPGLFPADLQVYGGDNQPGTPDEPLPRRVALRVVDAEGRPVANQEVTLQAFQANVVFRPSNRVLTSNRGVAIFEVIPPTRDDFEIEARISGGQSERIRVNEQQAGRSGLEAISGNYQIAVENTAFVRPTVVRTATTGIPNAGNTLTITPRDPLVTCPAEATTNSEGEATFQCAANDLQGAFSRLIRVGVRDSFGRELPEDLVFTIVGTEEELPVEPLELNRGEIVGTAGDIVEAAIRQRVLRLIGVGLSNAPNIGFEFEATRDSDVRFIPPVAPTDSQGVMSVDLDFGCRPRSGTITTIVNSPDEFETEYDYRIIPGPAVSMQRTQGNGQTGDAGERLDGPGQALVAIIGDKCGNPVGGEEVSYEVTPAGAATLENALMRSNSNGQISAIVVLGNSPGPVQITARTETTSTTWDLSINVTPTQLTKTGGDNQRVSVGALAPEELQVQLLNDQGLGAAGIDVTYEVVGGSGSFDGATVVQTDSSGIASLPVRAGSQLGPLLVEARAAGLAVVFELEVVGRTPQVSSLGFVNGASFVVGLTPGGLASIFGVGLMEGVDGVVFAGEAPFPTRLRGVRVLLNGVLCPIVSMANISGQEQINIQVPFFANAPSDSAVVTIENNGVSASFSGVRVFVVQPGIFEVTLPEGRFAAALHLDGTLVEPANPARPDEIIQLFWTGGGPISPAVGTNVPGPVRPLSVVENAVQATLDGKIIEIVGDSVYAPTLFTVYQTNIRVDPEAREGNLGLSLSQQGQASPEVQLPVRR